MRLIDADELLKYIEGNNTEREWVVNKYNADWIWSFIDSAPTIDAEAVRHGHWVARKVMARTPFAKNHYCSKCKFETHFCGNYCPNCGAKMDE